MKKLRYFIEARAVKLLAWLMHNLPRHVILVLARLAGTLAYVCDWRGRETSLENLRIVFGDDMDWLERHRVTRGCYQNFARTFFDLFWFGTLTRETWLEWFDVEVSPNTDLEKVRQSGAIWFTPHYGSFEMMGLVPSYLGCPFIVIAQDFKNPEITPIFSAARAVSGNTIVPQQAAALRVAKTLSRGGHTGILIDLSKKPEKSTGIVECFGLKASVPLLHVSFAQRFGLPMLPVIMEPKDDGRFRCRILDAVWSKPGDNESIVAQHCWDVCEREVRQHPEWWLWMYKQWRYLPGDDTDGRYPAYANPHKAFASLVKLRAEQREASAQPDPTKPNATHS